MLSEGFNGQKLNKDEPIKVEWTAAAAPEPAKPAYEDAILRAPTHKASTNFRASPQEIGNRSSPNLTGPPFEMGNRSPPPLPNTPSASGALSPPAVPYANGISSSSSQLNVNQSHAGPGARSPSLGSGIDLQGLHTQSPQPTSPGYANGGANMSNPMATQGMQGTYGNSNQPASPRNYLTGFRELP